jgi:ABC-type glutathione transport system ATPase component
MSLFKELNKILPYLQSIRKIEKYISIDVVFPNTWKIPKTYVDETKVMEQPSSDDNKRFFSFVSEIEDNKISEIKKNVENIVKYNLEREEKERLFKNKVESLKNYFEKESLDNLKSLTFKIETKEDFTLDDEQGETREVVGTTGKGEI